MRIHSLAMMAILTAALSFGCGSAREVRSSGNHSNAWGCDQCHGYPPPPAFPQDADVVHPRGVGPATCTFCHPATVLADGHTINATPITDASGTHIAHRDGQVEVVDYRTAVACDACHATPPATGRHAFHMSRPGVTCATCHRGYSPADRQADDATHMNGVPDVVLQNGHVVQAADEADGSWPTSECADCHSHLPQDG